MSIDTTPPGGGPSPPPPMVCAACFPIVTPDRIHFCIQGMKRGNLWMPGDPDPPNDHHAVNITAPCIWTATVGGLTYQYQIAGALTIFWARLVAGPNVFFSVVGPACQIWTANTLNNPAATKLYGGWATAVPEFVGVPFALPDLMSLMSEDPAWARWLQPRPMAANQVVYDLYDSLDATNVKIQIDHS